VYYIKVKVLINSFIWGYFKKIYTRKGMINAVCCIKLQILRKKEV